MGADPTRPPCQKAKDVRKARRLLKEQMRLSTPDAASSSPSKPSSSGPAHQPKTLEVWIDEALPEEAQQRLEVWAEH